MSQRLHPHLVRGTSCAAAATVSLTLLAAVGALFHHASRDGWLRDTPLAREAVARCQTLAERRQQQQCVRRVIVAARERDAGALRLLAQAAVSPASQRP